MKMRNGQMITVKNITRQALVADHCIVATGYWSRLRGLIGKKAMKPGEAMLFPRCNDIHMWFMSIPLDVVFLRKSKREDGTATYSVSSLHESVPPWKLLPLRDGKASETLELTVGTIRRCGISPGDELCLS